ncbi:amidophosphoribosyltransferase [Peptacetobacter hominis]|uniref:Amidophosphoribosyltransferase n=1 Tax=Peptacetobacter hominis TaxID=2743610 RepID=A0A544QWK1_9FIRM|nr:amidophosphoribosyltransferase [Peptacetobacter hominis]TQQ85073.1 amidophosphoribosyltransferase [Peptacetobacter hominis]
MSGILGVYSDKDVSKELYYGIYSMQHRGQESCGMAIYDTEASEIVYKKEKGLVGDAFKEEELKNYKGNIGIAHVRSSSVGHNHVSNTQPFVGSCRSRKLAIVDNGSLVNANYLRDSLEEEGFMFQTNSDAEVILHILARYYKGDIVEAVKMTMDHIKGSYTLALICDDSLVAVRDPHGFRSLLLGKKGNEYLVASENSAIEILGGEVIRDVEPGEIIVVKDGELKSYHYSEVCKPVKKSCIFEHVYIARNDATIDGLNAYEFRINCGAYLARNEDIKADCVVPVPDSGWAGAIGYANESGLKTTEGLVKNRYVGRTFIKPTQEEREIAVRIKLNPLASAIKGKSIILVDDSIVRGTTSKQLVKSLREAGAKEVHLRITSPPVKFPCYYGIDTPTRESLLAASHSVEEMREYIGCDTLKFISLEGMKEAAHGMNTFCTSCFDGDYAVKKIDK